MEMAGSAKYLHRQRSITDPNVGGIVLLSLEMGKYSSSDRSIKVPLSGDYVNLPVIQLGALENGPRSQGIDDDE